jgi:hypothetical protein
MISIPVFGVGNDNYPRTAYEYGYEYGNHVKKYMSVSSYSKVEAAEQKGINMVCG